MRKFMLNLIMTGFSILGIVALSFAQQSVTAVKGPDLIVEKIECGKGNKLLFTIKNIGTGPLPSGWVGKSHVWINGRSLFDSIGLDRPISTASGGIVNVGGTSSYEAPYVINTGITVKVETDYGNHIRELNEGNNSKTVKLQPCDRVGKPDLTVKLVINGPVSNVRPGFAYSPGMIGIEVSNIGTVIASGTRSAGSRGYIISRSVTPHPFSPTTDITDTLDIPSGGTQRYSWGDFAVPSDAVRGSAYELCVHTDPTNVVDELREDNNKNCTRITVSP